MLKAIVLENHCPLLKVNHVIKVYIKVRTAREKPGKSWNFVFQNPDLEILENPL